MKIQNCTKDLWGQLFYYVLAVIAEVFILVVCEYQCVILLVCLLLDVCLVASWVIDWCYFGRKIILDKKGCTFIRNKSRNTFDWAEVNVQYYSNNRYSFGDAEEPGEGIILSVNPIRKPEHIAAMTYCRFSHPATSVFIRFDSKLCNSTHNTAKFVYKGFYAQKCELLDFLTSQDVVIGGYCST